MVTQRIVLERQVEFSAKVTDIREASRENGQSVWQIALDRTAFASGDTGFLRATARSGASIEIPVVQVEEDGSGEIWHVTAKPLLADTWVTGVVTG